MTLTYYLGNPDDDGDYTSASPQQQHAMKGVLPLQGAEICVVVRPVHGISNAPGLVRCSGRHLSRRVLVVLAYCQGGSATDFKLRHPSWRHDYQLRAASPEERQEWVAALRLDPATF